MRLKPKFGIIAALAGALVFAATLASAQAAEKVKVLASFSIIGDLVRQVGGDHVDVDLLVGPNVDMHHFQPSPADSRKFSETKLVVINGLGLESWADRLVKAAGYRGARLVASKGVKALAGHEHEHGHGEGHGRYDPHAWQDVANVKIYVANIRDALSGVDPANKAAYQQNAENYLKQLDALDRDIRAAWADIPKPRRRVITSHEAFDYYGDAYDVEFLAAQGVSEDAEPSARDIAKLIQQIKKEKITAIFVENISSGRLMDRIAKETGAKIGGELYSDALSPAGGPAATYIDMMRHNTRAITDALRTGG
ncbi:MAG: metal ABC transporter substrate-binding protein [Rhodoplanes sp.]